MHFSEWSKIGDSGRIKGGLVLELICDDGQRIGVGGEEWSVERRKSE